MRTYTLIPAIVAGLMLVGAPAAYAGQPNGLPPSGSTCGAFYGAVVSQVARTGALTGEVNPGVLHQGFAGAESFPGFDCP
jgi:hypothetical protein